MASQGPLSPTTTTDDSGVGTLTWNNVNNVQASDNVYATRNMGGSSNVTHYIKCVGYGFSVPGTATIVGIEVTIEGKVANAASNSTVDDRVRLVKAGTIQSTDRAFIEFNNGDNEYVHGSPTDLWGDTWTPSDINNANFGAAFAARSNSGADDISIDHISITVYYTDTVDVTVNPAVTSVVFSLIAATVLLGSTISPAAQAANFSIASVTPKTDQVLAQNALSATFSIPEVTFTNATSVTIIPNAQAASFTTPAPNVNTEQILSIGVKSIVASIPSVAPATDQVISSNVQVAVFSTQGVVVSNGAIISPAAQALISSLPAVTVIGNGLILPSTQSLTFSVPTLSIISNTVVSIATQILSFSIKTPARFGSFYNDKYQRQDTSYTNKYSQQSTSYNDLYTPRNF